MYNFLKKYVPSVNFLKVVINIEQILETVQQLKT